MEKILKNIIITILIIYFIINIMDLVYNYIVIKENMSGLVTYQEGNIQTHEETITLQEGMNIYKTTKLNYFNGMSNMVYQMYHNTILSIMLGIALGLLISFVQSCNIKKQER